MRKKLFPFSDRINTLVCSPLLSFRLRLYVFGTNAVGVAHHAHIRTQTHTHLHTPLRRGSGSQAAWKIEFASLVRMQLA